MSRTTAHTPVDCPHCNGTGIDHTLRHQSLHGCFAAQNSTLCQHTEAYQEGWDVCLAGGEHEHNPYIGTPEAGQWGSGFNAAHATGEGKS